jgi:methyl-accepting chemotaxis protein
MNFEEARKKHAEWRVKFRSAISAKATLDASTIAKDNCCDLGKWLYGEAKSKYAALPSYQACVKKHAAFHVEASKVACVINSKKYDDAQAMLGIGSGFSSASGAIGNALDALERDATLSHA